jgi:L-rhamnose mutarotase
MSCYRNRKAALSKGEITEVGVSKYTIPLRNESTTCVFLWWELEMTNDMESPTRDRKSRRSSREVALEIAKESDPNHLIELAKELNESLLAEEQQKIAKRMGRSAITANDRES